MKNILAVLFGLLIVGPIRSYRIMRLGAQRVAAFRATHGREPTDAEWAEISQRVGEECL